VYSTYKYALAVENNSEYNYATEKIWEPLVSECLPFYWGCPNLEDHIDPNCFVRLPLEDPAKAAEIVKTAIAEDWWSKRIDSIRATKKKIITEMGMSVVLRSIIARSKKTKAVVLTLHSSKDRIPIVEKLQTDLTAFGMENEVFYGVNGKDLIVSSTKIVYNKETRKYDRKLRLNGQTMTLGEFGCAWSHIKIYEKLLADTDADNYLIMEDDAQFVGDLNILQDLPLDFEVAHVATSDWYPFVKTSQVNKSFFNIEKKFFNHTTAYVVSKAGARKLLSMTNESISLPADDLLSNSFIQGKIQVIVPESPVFTFTKDIASTIDSIESR
jgi:GR25 family glycosyltransferase involved in LPS biosynthesis